MSGSTRLSCVRWPVADLSVRLASHDAVLCATSLCADDATLGRSLPLLSRDERARFEAYTNAVVARRFAVGRSALREIIGCALGMAPTCIPLREGLHGKPALGRDAGGRGLWFSIAHTEDVMLVALSRSFDVGIDVERSRSIEQWERVADRVLASGERAQLQHAVEAGEDAGTAFLRHWCRVEAELKAIGCGIAGLEDHRAGKRPLGLRIVDLKDVPFPDEAVSNGVRYQAALALCSPVVDSARQSARASAQAIAPTIEPVRASTA